MFQTNYVIRITTTNSTKLKKLTAIFCHNILTLLSLNLTTHHDFNTTNTKC
jgi:hypothetical protein